MRMQTDRAPRLAPARRRREHSLAVLLDWSTIVVTAFVAVTAVAGGVALVFGPPGGLLVPPRSMIAGSPFDSYVVPGILLAVVVGGSHVAASVLVARGERLAPMVTTASGAALLVFVFVEMLVLPSSPLQAVYFGLGLAELLVVTLRLGTTAGLVRPPRREGTR